MNNAPLLWPRMLVFVVFLAGVNILSGYLAITFNYPSLFNVKASFGEYAIPLPFTWALAHWPSMLIYGIPLLYHTQARQKLTQYYRLFCAISFVMLLLEQDAKIPFLLFPMVDAATGLLLSLVLVAPTRKANPVLFPTVCLAGLAAVGTAAFIVNNQWQHRTPSLNTTEYADGVFKLTAIEVYRELHELRIIMDLTTRMDNREFCATAQQVAEQVVQDYPFDASYNRLIKVWFNPASQDLPENNGTPYRLGEISLNTNDRAPDGSLACYLSYKQ